MNTQRLAAAIKEIDRLSLALHWLEEYGDHLDPKDRDSFSIYIQPAAASACVGCKEAAEQLNAIARLHIHSIVEQAKKDAVNTIEIHATTIREEAGAGIQVYRRPRPTEP